VGLAILEFVVSAAVVIAAGTVLARAADRIAEITGLGRLVIGGVLLAGATSLPELSVDVNAALRGLDDLAVGDLMGSSLANLVILAVADLLTRSKGGMLSRAAARHALSGAMAIALTALAGLMIVSRFGVSLGGVGLGSLIVFAAYAAAIRIIVFDQRMAAREAGPAAAGHAEIAGAGSLRRPAVQFSAAAIVILVAAPFVARSGGRIAELSGLGNTFVGTTLIAMSTSLPELVATLASVRMGAFDLAVANIFGSNAFNMAMLLPIDLASDGPLLSKVSTTHVTTGLWGVVITGVAIVGQLYHVERRRRLIEPDALLIIVLVAVALVMVYHQG
jgi:cation:H+ antiporter